MLTLFRTPAVSSSGARVDRAAGIIRGASVVTTGEARGHGVFVDDTTLAQVVACAQARGDGGVAVKFNPSTFDHGPGAVAGSARNFRVVGRQVVADIFLLKSFSDRAYLLELVEDQPGTFGLSMDFEMTEETIGSRAFARVVALDAVSVVDVPAANPNGFFRAGPATASHAPKNLFTVRSHRPNQPTMSSPSAAAFQAKIKAHESAGASHGKAILLARQGDAAGFNAWSAVRAPVAPSASRPAPSRGFSASAGPTATATGFSARVRGLQARGDTLGAAILRAAYADRAGFNAWCRAGRPA